MKATLVSIQPGASLPGTWGCYTPKISKAPSVGKSLWSVEEKMAAFLYNAFTLSEKELNRMFYMGYKNVGKFYNSNGFLKMNYKLSGGKSWFGQI